MQTFFSILARPAENVTLAGTLVALIGKSAQHADVRTGQLVLEFSEPFICLRYFAFEIRFVLGTALRLKYTRIM